MNEMLESVGFLNFVPRAKLRWKKRIIEKRNTIRSHVFVLFAPLPLLFNFYDVSPYFYYASCFMIEYVMEDIEFRDIPFSVYATTNRTKIYVGIIFYNNALNVSI